MNAMRIFLRDGFEAASYETIGREMGLTKTSLYNAFGDKLALFQRVLDIYAVQAHHQITAALTQQNSLAEGVINLLRSAALVFATENAPSVGCLLVGTALPATAQHDGVRQVLSHFTKALDQSLEDIVANDYADQIKAMRQSPRSIALRISSLIYALAIRAREGHSQKELLRLAEELGQTFSPTQ